MGKRSKNKYARKHEKRGAGSEHSRFWFSTPLHTIASYLRKHWVPIKSILIFTACILVFMLVYSQTAGEEQMLGLRGFIASITGGIAGLFNDSVNVSGTSVSSPRFSMEIITACTGLIAMGIFTAAVLAYPCRLIRKVEGIAIGVFGLFLVNTARMVSLFFIGYYLPDFFDNAHYIVGQSLMILITIGLWLVWLEKRVNVVKG